MESIKLKTIKLVCFEKKNDEHLKYLKRLLSDESIMSRFQGIFPALVSRNEFFDKGFFIGYNGELIGCILFGNYNSDSRSVYIRGFALDKEHRGIMLNDKRLSQIAHDEVVQYIFDTYNEIDSIKISVSPDNIAGNRSAIRYGYSHDSDTNYSKSR